MSDEAPMDSVLSPPDLANAVTAFSTIGTGIVTLTLCWLGRPQPARWLFAYLCILITGIPTLGWHGWMTDIWHVLDIGTNLLLAWALQVAVLGDFYSRPVRTRFIAISTSINVLAVGLMLLSKLQKSEHLALSFGGFGGYYPGELMLIADALSVLTLFILRRSRISTRSAPLLRAVTITFIVGLALSTAHGTTLHARVLSYHALWHIVGGFGFFFLWAFNDVRFHEQAARVPSDVVQSRAA